MDNDTSGEFIINPDSNENSAPAAARPAIEKSNPHFYSNLLVNPANITFENQEEGEEIVLLVRRDLITNLPWIITAIVLLFVPPVVGLLSPFFSPIFTLSGGTQLIFALFFYLIVFGFILIEFMFWYFNIGLVTTKRVIDFDVTGVLAKHVSETHLNIIEDVSYSQVGSVRTIFNYGDVIMQTAGTHNNFEFDRSPEPSRIVRIIADMIGGPR